VSRRGVVVLGVVLVALVGLGGGAWYVLAGRSGAAAQPVPVTRDSGPAVPVAVDLSAGVVQLGPAGAARTVDVYEDLLAPDAVAFQRADFPELRALAATGALRVRLHVLGILASSSAPIGYSQRAANALLAVAERAPDRALDFRASLLAAQPAQGTPGWSDDQLLGLAERLGVPDLADQVRGAVHQSVITAASTAAAHDAKLWTMDAHGALGLRLPTVVVQGTTVSNWRDPGWVTALG
jgi:hypothetical protein